MKKFLLAPLFLVSMLAAQQASAQTANFEGASASVGLSMAGATSKLALDAGDAYTQSFNFGKTNLIGVLNAGYGFALKPNFVLGVGASIDLGKTKAGGINMGGQGIDFAGKNHYSIYVQPTWVVTPTTGLYAKLGYDSIKGKGEISIPVDTSEIPSLGKGRKLNGTTLGLGVKTFVNSNVFVQVEASTTSFGSTAAPFGSEAAASMKVKSVAGTVSVGYRF